MFRYSSIAFISLCVWMGAVQAQNHAFSDADNSHVKYWLTPYESQGACVAIQGLSNSEFTINNTEDRTVNGTDIKFCKVDGLIPQEIQFQVNLPSKWNGRIYMHGNGGNGGMSPDHPRRWNLSLNALKQGFAVIYSNGGHDAEKEPGISFAENNYDKELDHAHRATQLARVAGKKIAGEYYQRESDYDYFDGCSWGGGEAFAMAQRFPELFDGILAGSPVFNFTGIHFGLRKLLGEVAPDWPGQKDTDVIASAVLKKCDGLDGLEDGVILDPGVCEFDPVVDLPECVSTEEGHCISDEMREKLASVYQPVVVGKKTLALGRPVSSEIKGYQQARSGGPGAFAIRDGWSGSFSVNGPDARPFMLGRLQDAVKVFLFEDDMTRSWLDFDLERDWQAVIKNAQHLDDTNPDLRALQANGSKLLAYHGWADFNINPNLTYEYFEEVHREMGPEAANETARLFMVPGMFHCGGGSDVFEFDGMTPLINWVERGEAPGKIIFSGNANFHPDRKRPVCAFPSTAHYTGGDIDRPSSFECR
jgi:hypothetical protein